MRSLRLLSAATAALALAVLPLLCAAQTAPAPVHAVYGYYCIYCQYQSGRHFERYSVKQIADSGAAAKMTALYYAFGRVENNRCELWTPAIETDQIYTAQTSVSGVADARDAGSGASQRPGRLRGIFHQLQELKARYPNLKVVMSLGGGGLSQGFPSAAEPQNVKAFVHSCVEKFIRGHIAPGIDAPGLFDGIDVDWEMPVWGSGGVRGRPEDTKNYVALAREFRRQLDAVRPGLLLTAALPAGEHFLQYFDLKGMSKSMNDLAIMGYDMASGRARVTSFGSPLYPDPDYPAAKEFNDVFAVHYLEQHGVPAQKILLGVPFGSGPHWYGVKDINHGLYQPVTGSAPTSSRPVVDWRGTPRGRAARPAYDLAIPITSPWDDAAGADRVYWPKIGSCSSWKDGVFSTFDCPQAMSAKAAYAREQGLGGVMLWEITHDPGGALLDAAAGGAVAAENTSH